MAIVQHSYTLLNKKALTHDVFELQFSCSEAPPPLPGQYVLFLLPSGLRRAYSISFFQEGIFHYIIKRLPHEGAWSREICDIEIGQALSGMGPLGHFTLTDGEVSRLFIGTGTGFAPLYFQIKALEQRRALSRTHFLFGVRTEDDVFLQEEIVRIQSENPNFSFEQYISRPKDASSPFRKGYVTEALTPEYIGQFQEFFICWSPVMVKDVREKLSLLGISKEAIHFEQY